MTLAPLQESALYIERLHTRYVIADEAPEEVRARCESALATMLPSALANTLQRSLSPEDPSLWFIRRLDVNFSVASTIEHAQVGEVWAKEIAPMLVDALHSEDPEILHFPDRASYLAHFLIDAAEGSAWDRWYYSDFEGLRMLPTSAALRTAICRSPETGLGALRLLSEEQRRILLKSIGPGDVRRILSAFASDSGSGSESDCLRLLVEAWNAGLGFQPHDEERRALALFLAVSQQRPEFAGETLRALVVAACRLSKHLYERGDRTAETMAAVCGGNLAALYTLLGTDAESLAPLLHGSAEALEQLLQRVVGDPVVNPTTRRETRFTAFGGAFLLFPILDEFPFQSATSGWPGLGDLSAAALVRFLVLAKCFGRERVLGCMRDPLVRNLLQIPPAISPPAIAEWLASVPREQLFSFLRTHAAFHFDTGAADAEIFLLTKVAHKGAPVTLLLDGARGLWLFARRGPKRTEPLPLAQIDLPQPKQLLCHADLWQAGRNAFPESQLQPLPSGDQGAFPAAPGLARDLIYLELPLELRTSSLADLTVSVAAQGVLRRLAMKLPGFAKSSLDYLNRNFLDCCAAVEEAAEQRVVTLARPPLHIVLSMAGLNRCTYRLSWLDGRPCAVFPEG